MKKYYDRLIDKALVEELEAFGAVLITGPKWCGKTTSAKRIAKSVINFQDQDMKTTYIETANIKPSALLEGDKPRLIDEWQVIPQIWDSVRQSVDEINEEGLYILTGSNKVDKSKIMHSGIGRISRLQMRTLSLYESEDSNGMVSLERLFTNDQEMDKIISSLSIDDIAEIVVRGGWPSSIDKKITTAMRQNSGYVDLITNEEMETYDGKVRDAQKVRQLLQSYARHISTPASDTTLLADVYANDSSIHINTVVEYLQTLRELYVIEELPSWTPKLRSKSTIRTKHIRHFTDPAIAASLLKATPKNLISDIKTFGLLFESLVIRDLRIYAQHLNGEVLHYRDSTNLEVDAIIKLQDGSWAAIEIKLGSHQIDEAANNLIALVDKVDTIKPAFLMVITGTPYGYQREDGVYVVPIGCLRP
jgi:predicted AAA+ superfamily ATPase